MGRKKIADHTRYEIEQLIDLANTLTPDVDWPTPEKLDELDAKIVRLDREGQNTDDIEAERERVLLPAWKAATRRFPPRAGDPGIGDPRDHRGGMVILRKPPILFFIS